jgi:hypothetical protein
MPPANPLNSHTHPHARHWEVRPLNQCEERRQIGRSSNGKWLVQAHGLVSTLHATQYHEGGRSPVRRNNSTPTLTKAAAEV